MKPIYINLDVSATQKQTNIIIVKPDTPQELYYRLYENKYEIDYAAFEELRLIFDDKESGDVFTATSSEVVEINKIKHVKIVLPLNITNKNVNYTVRPVYRTGGVNRGLKKFIAFTRLESSADITSITSMIAEVNSIYSLYLNSIKRQEIGAPLGVVPLDDKAQVIEKYIPQDILDHIKEFHVGHGLRLNDDYFIEYWDTDDKVWYLMNILSNGKFNVPRKSSIFSFHGGYF